MNTTLNHRLVLLVAAMLLNSSGCQDSGDAKQDAAKAVPGSATADREIPATSSQVSQLDDLQGRPPEMPDNTSPFPGQADPGIEIRPAEPRTTTAGRWEFQLSAQGTDIPGLLLEIDLEDEAHPKVTIVDDTDSMPGWQVTSFELTNNSAHIEFGSHEGAPVDFRGQLANGEVRGNVIYGLEGCELARLVPSQRENLDGVNPRPSEGAREMASLQQAPDPVTAWREAARKFPASALAYDIYRVIFNTLRQPNSEAADLSPLIDEYLAAAQPWGERVVARAQLDIGYTLAVAGHDSTLALKHLDLAEQQLGDQATPAQESKLTLARGMAFLQSEEPDDVQLGTTILHEIRTQEPFNLMVTEALANHAEKSGRDDEALQLLAEVAVLPAGQRDEQRVSDLWQRLGREPDQLAAFLDNVYEQAVYRFAETPPDTPAPIEKQKVILGELFTGATCPPCVAADLATGGLEQTYPQSLLIMLRHHQHVPGPDPLVCEDGMQRADYYQIQGTPSLFLNGAEIQVDGMYGPLFNAPLGYEQLREQLATLLPQTSDLELNLTASTDGEVVKVQAAVAGLGEQSESLRLRLVLAEHKVSFAARNGIRLHEMLVRAMPGGPEGQAPVDGVLKLEAEVNLNEVREGILAHLASVEERMQRQFEEKPVDLENLMLVAFVQDDNTREVLQSSAIPVVPE